MMRHLFFSLQIVTLLLVMTACGSSSTARITPSPTSLSTPTPTSTPSPTVIPTIAIPTTWITYHEKHFSVQYPPDWEVDTNSADKGGFLGDNGISYIFTPPSGGRSPIEIMEGDNNSSTTFNDRCSWLISNKATKTTLANIPMYTITAEGIRGWYFFASNGTAFFLQADASPLTPDIQAQNTMILQSFKPDITTPYCS
jgi:hypothetical protein